MGCRLLLIVVLSYLALDLALPAMPGAFVFDVSDSVESIGGARGREAPRVVVLPVPDRRTPVLSAPSLEPRPARVSRPEVVLLVCPQVSRLPRAACDPSSISEDPH